MDDDQAQLDIALPGDLESALSRKAGAIRALGKNLVRDVIEIGRHLTDAKKLCRHGDWLPWLEREFGWSEMTAQKWMRVYKMTSKSKPGLDLALDLSSLYALAAPSTPAEVRAEIAERVDSGEQITQEDVQRAIDEALAKLAPEYEQKIASVKREVIKREAEVRAEFEGKIITDDAELAKIISKATRPLNLNIAGLEDKLAKAKASVKRLQDRFHSRGPAPDAKKLPLLDQDLALRSTTIRSILGNFVSALRMTPAELIAIERQIAEATGQTVEARLAEAAAHAQTASAWLGLFIKLAAERN